MLKFFELNQYKDADDLEIICAANNVYLGKGNKTILEVKDNCNDLLLILQEFNIEEYEDTLLFKRIVELYVLSLLYKYRILIETNTYTDLQTRSAKFRVLEKKIKDVIVLCDDVDVNELLSKVSFNNINNITWEDNRFVSCNFRFLEKHLEVRLNQSEFIIRSTFDTKLLFNAGDIFEYVDSDSYIDYVYFEHRTFKSPMFLYNDLTPLKYQLMKDIIDKKITLKFNDEELKKSVLHDFIDNVIYCTARLNYSDDVDSEFYSYLKQFISVIAFSEVL